MLPDLAGGSHTFEQRGEVAALDPNELDAPGRLEQARIERADLHIAEIDQRPTASATVLALAIKARDDTLIGRPDMAGEVTPRNGFALDANPYGVEPVRPF